MLLVMWTSVWAPTDVDFVACFPLHRRFFRRRRRISRSVLRGNATLSSSTQPQQRQKRGSKQNKNSKRTLHVLAGFPFCHCTSHVVKRGWNHGNAILALIWKIVATNTHTEPPALYVITFFICSCRDITFSTDVRAVVTYANTFS